MADNKDKPFHYGGQAVIEGVMMRGRKDFAVAVRRADGEIVSTREDIRSILGKLKWLDKPFLRGTLALVDALVLGIKALKYSANIAMEDAVAADAESKAADAQSDALESADDPQTESGAAKNDAEPKNRRVNDLTVGIMMVLGLALGVGLFFFLPIVITKPLKSALSGWQLTATEGAIKISLFLAYVLLISLMRDIRRVFQYHGAEHKTINAYEAKAPLTVENVKDYTKVHVRCGTSFVLVVLVTSIIVFMVVVEPLPYGSLSNPNAISYLMRFLYKLALLPFVAGIAYEVIRFAGNRKDWVLTRIVLVPGLLMQKITTREPEPEMIEVAIKSLESVLEREASEGETQVAAV